MGGADVGRNVDLVSVDSLRADVCFGDDSVRTPALAALAGSGGRFVNAIAPGLATYESMPAIFIGVDVPPVGPIGGVAKREHIRTPLRSH